MIPGVHVIVSKQLPLHPSAGEVGRRIVRHGLADVLEWLGEELGPHPEALTHAISGMDLASPVSGGLLFVSEEMYRQLRGRAALGDLNHPERARRQAAEAAWLVSHRAHRAGAADGH